MIAHPNYLHADNLQCGLLSFAVGAPKISPWLANAGAIPSGPKLLQTIESNTKIRNSHLA